MYTKEEIRKEFATAKEKDLSGKTETFVNRAAMMKKHMEEEREMPELYESMEDRNGKPFNFAGLYETYSSDNPKEYFFLKHYGLTYREVWMKKDPKAFSGSTEDMIENVSVEVPNVPKDDLSNIVEEMSEV